MRYSQNKGGRAKNVPASGAFQEHSESRDVAIEKWKKEMLERYKVTRDQIKEWEKVRSRMSFTEYWHR